MTPHRFVTIALTAAAGLFAVVSLPPVNAADNPDAGAASGATQDSKASRNLAVRGLHLSAPGKADLPMALEFIRTVLPRHHVNTLVLEIDFQYDFQSRPEFGDPSALGSTEMRRIAQTCREAGVTLIPQINCLGHQSWAKRTDRLLTKHPEFDETPGKYPNNEGIYCRSYCPLNPGVHEVLFDLIDELVRDTGASAFHVGMDEVFILADPDCPRCHGKTPAELFAGEVRRLHDHLKQVGCRMWMWGDRFLDGRQTGLGKWEASENGTAPSIDQVPKDIMICDWHYDRAPDTPKYFAKHGFDVVICPWRNTSVGLAELKNVMDLSQDADESVARHAQGVLQTTWCGFRAFANAWHDLNSGKAPAKSSAAESAACFSAVFERVNPADKPGL